jgi:hypothetical protein
MTYRYNWVLWHFGSLLGLGTRWFEVFQHGLLKIYPVHHALAKCEYAVLRADVILATRLSFRTRALQAAVWPKTLPSNCPPGPFP